MSTTASVIINIIENLAPLSYAYKWDNIGLQLGSREDAVNTILTTLEVTDIVLEEAIEKKIDLIITHHPMIFSPLKNIIKEDMKGKLVYKAIQNNIAIYATHTNMDIAPGGLNDYIAKRLKIKDTEVLDEIVYDIHPLANEGPVKGLGRFGKLDNPKTIKDLVTKIKEQMNIEHIRVVGDLEATVEKVAVINGSGADLIQIALHKGCQCVITGDVKYHDAQDAISQGINLIDIGHYHSEKFFSDFMAEYLKVEMNKKGLNINIIQSAININPFQTI